MATRTNPTQIGVPQQTAENSPLSTLREQVPQQCEKLIEHVKAYVRENPETAALAALGIGFVLGWKLKPW